MKNPAADCWGTGRYADAVLTRFGFRRRCGLAIGHRARPVDEWRRCWRCGTVVRDARSLVVDADGDGEARL